jgi:hypothetical protein
MKKLAYGAFSVIVSSITLFLFLIMLAPKIELKINDVANTIDEKVVHTVKLNDKEESAKHDRQIACLNDATILDKTICFEKDEVIKEPIKQTSEVKEEIKLTSVEWGKKQILDASFFIQLVYVVSLFALTIQLYQYLLLRSNNASDFLIENRQTISEACINIPPVLGVLATLFAFAQSTAMANSGLSVMEAFRSGVFDATSTTILGGMVYGFNMVLHIYIQRELKAV